MSIELVTTYLPYVDEIFASESKSEILTNKNFEFEGSHAVKIWKISTVTMNDYGRTGASSGNWSRYGEVLDLEAETETLTLSKDRSFTFTVDAMDENESGIVTAEALARQIRNVVVPEIDTYVISKMATNAGTKPTAETLTADNVYDCIIAGSNALDTAEVPETGRILCVTPSVFALLKKSNDVMKSLDMANEIRKNGVIGMIDGMQIIRVPASRVPTGFGFMIAHPCATVGVQKLASYKTHDNPIGINGTLVEGRIVYDAFVLDNQKNGIYYQAVSTTAE